MGSTLERAYSRSFLLIGFKTLEEMHFGPCYLGSKGLQNSEKRSLTEGETSSKLRMAQNLIFGQRILLLLDRPATNQQKKFSRKCPKTLWKCLWTMQNLPKKIQVKKLKKMQKRTKESKLSLGSWIAFWAANMIFTFMLDITLRLERKNYCMQAKYFTEYAVQKLIPLCQIYSKWMNNA